jgi:hypothetical protein
VAAALVKRWVTQLRPGGILALDEVEYVHTTNQVLARYEQMVVALIAARGSAMYAGPLLGGVISGHGWSVPASDVVACQVPNADAAAMFALRLPTWADNPAITSLVGRRHPGGGRGLVGPDAVQRDRRDQLGPAAGHHRTQ